MEKKSLKNVINSKMNCNRLRNILLAVVSIIFSLLFETVYIYFKTITVQTEAYGQKQNIDIVTFILLIAIVSIFACIAYYNILNISFDAEKPFFSKINILEEKIRKTQTVVYLYMLKINIIGNIVGWILGRIVGSAIAIAILPFSINKNNIPVSIFEILFIAVLGSVVFSLGSLFPIYSIKNMKKETTEEKNANYFEERKKVKKVLGCPAIINLSISNLLRYNKRVITSIVLLICGITLANSIYIKHKSYSFDQYKEQQLISHFEIGNFEEDNPKIYSEEKSIVEKFLRINEIDKVGYIHAGQMEMPMIGTVYNRFFEYFNEAIVEDMKDNTALINEYQNIKENEKCTVTILGIDEFVLNKLSGNSTVFSGDIDEKSFQKKQSIIIQGVSSDEEVKKQPFQAGDSVLLNNMPFNIMAVIDAPLTLTEISSSPGFGITLYVSQEVFGQLFRDEAIKKVLFDVSAEEMEATNKSLSDLGREVKTLNIKSERSVYSLYQKEVKNSILLEAFIAFALIGTGMVCMINSMIDSIRERKNEIMLMKIIGAERIQIEKMLMYEGAIFSGLTIILSYIMVFSVGTVVAKLYLQQQWASQYYFSLLPINIISPIFLCLGVLIPLMSYKILYTKQ